MLNKKYFPDIALTGYSKRKKEIIEFLIINYDYEEPSRNKYGRSSGSPRIEMVFPTNEVIHLYQEYTEIKIEENSDLDEIKCKITEILEDSQKLFIYPSIPFSSGNIERNLNLIKEVKQKLSVCNCIIVEPLDKEYNLKTKEEVLEYEKNNTLEIFTSCIDKMNKSDLIFIYEPDISKGVSIEQGISRCKKPILYISPKDTLRSHPFVRYSSNWIFQNLDSAIDFLCSESGAGYNETTIDMIKNMAISMKNEFGPVSEMAQK